MRVGTKEQEKVEKYQDLRREIEILWGMKKTEVIPIVVGALGMISKKLEIWIEKIGINIRTEPFCRKVRFLELQEYCEELWKCRLSLGLLRKRTTNEKKP